MFFLNPQEKNALLFLAVILLAGSTAIYVSKRAPALADLINVMDDESMYFKIDVNTATREELIAVPYIGEYTADQILLHRESNGGFTRLEQLKEVSGIKEDNYKRFKPYLSL